MPHKRKELKISDINRWYLVGLITADGCLSKDGRHINITSKDKDFLNQLKNIAGIQDKVGVKNKGRVNQAYKIEFSNKNFYEFLISIGLIPNKSLRLEGLEIPKAFFTDFLRGLIDGDGSLRKWKHPSNLHEQWSLRIYSGSKIFMEWLRVEIEKKLGCKGKLYSELRPSRRNYIYILKYGKLAAQVIVRNCYYDDSFGLDRKKQLSYKCSQAQVGWHKSNTLTFGNALT